MPLLDPIRNVVWTLWSEIARGIRRNGRSIRTLRYLWPNRPPNVRTKPARPGWALVAVIPPLGLAVLLFISLLVQIAVEYTSLKRLAI